MSASARIAAAVVTFLLPFGGALARSLDYVVTLDGTLARASVRLHASEPLYRLEARGEAARRSLRSALSCDGSRLRTARGRIDAGGQTCIELAVRLVPGVRRSGPLPAGSLVTVARDWLWRPGRRASDAITVSFELPDGFEVSTPWRPGGDGRMFAIDPSPASGRAYVVFGRFDHSTVEVPGATLRIANLAMTTPESRQVLAGWLGSAAANVVTLYGRFPNPSPQVVVLPASRRSDSPVPFGMVSRNGGESVLFYVDPSRDLPEFVADWTATHEFSHLLLPYVRDKWISEGFATYLQNVLLARGGAYRADYAWRRLAEGFARGAASSPELSPRAASRGGGWGSTMKVYWSGAWLALAADVELRRRSHGRESLGSALQRLAGCCLPAARSWGSRELMRELDRLSGGSVFVGLYEQVADEPGFPDYDTLFETLGVELSGTTVRFDDTAADAGIRRAIMRVGAASSRDGR